MGGVTRVVIEKVTVPSRDIADTDISFPTALTHQQSNDEQNGLYVPCARVTSSADLHSGRVDRL